MNQLPCCDCGKDISRTALKCLFCGCELPTLPVRALRFRAERVELFAKCESIPKIENVGTLVAHVIPSNAMNSEDSQINLGDATSLEPFGGYAEGSFNFHGLIRQRKSKDSTQAYIQIFRNGIIESAANVSRNSQEKIINFSYWEEEIIKQVSEYISFLQNSNGKAPVQFLLSLLNVKDYFLDIPWGFHAFQRAPILDSTILLPPVEFPVFTMDIKNGLKASFDMIWNAGGFPGSFHYDENGLWRELT